jgi:hypothetical protein
LDDSSCFGGAARLDDWREGECREDDCLEGDWREDDWREGDVVRFGDFSEAGAAWPCAAPVGDGLEAAATGLVMVLLR